MLQFQTILHPTDFSEYSNYALGLAGALAKDSGARLIVLHVDNPPTMIYGEGMLPPAEPPNHLDRLRGLLNGVTLNDRGVRVERCLTEGDTVKEILRVAEDARCDLIVMGTHGRSGIGRFLMGSVAEQVVRKAPCPVVTVRAPFRQDSDPGAAQAETSRLEAVGR